MMPERAHPSPSPSPPAYMQLSLQEQEEGAVAAAANAASPAASSRCCACLRSPHCRVYAMIVCASILGAIFVVLLAVGWWHRSAAGPHPPTPLQRRWTVLYHIAYNNGLDVYLDDDMSKLASAQFTGNDVAFHFLISTRSHPVPYHVRVQGIFPARFWQANSSAVLPSAPEQLPYTGWPQADLALFLSRATAIDPAEQYAFMYNGDGGCVYLSIQDAVEKHSKAHAVAKLRSSSFAASSSPPPPLAWTKLGVSDLARIFRESPVHLSLLVFDACQMAVFETAYELRTVTDVMLASEQYEGGVGFNSPALVEAFRSPPPAELEVLDEELDPYETRVRGSIAIASALARDYMRRLNISADLEPGDTLLDKRDATIVRMDRISALLDAVQSLQQQTPRIVVPPAIARDNSYVDPLPEDETAYVDLYETMRQQYAPDSWQGESSLLALRQSAPHPAATFFFPRRDDPSLSPLLWQNFHSAFVAALPLYLQSAGFQAWNSSAPVQSTEDGLWYYSDAKRFHGLSVCVDAHFDSSPGAALYANLSIPEIFTHW